MQSSDDWEGWSRATYIAYGLSELVAIACSIAAIVIVATVVRRHRPDAFGALLAWSIVALAVGIVWPIATTVWIRAVAIENVRAIMRAQTLSTLCGIPLHVMNFVLLIRGIVRLAQPPKPVVPDAVGPYR